MAPPHKRRGHFLFRVVSIFPKFIRLSYNHVDILTAPVQNPHEILPSYVALEECSWPKTPVISLKGSRMR